MSLADSLGPLIVPPKAGRPDAQTPRLSSSQAPGRASFQAPERPDSQAPKRPGLPLQGTAKRNHPDFKKKSLYVREQTMIQAFRRYQDEEGGTEQSDLVQMLLERYAAGGRRG